MRTSLTTLFCSLLILALGTGCGKKINDVKVNKAQYQQEERSGDLTLVVDEEVSTTTFFKVPENGLFKLPSQLNARFGNAVGKKITIFYNVSSSHHYEFQCTYSSTQNKTTLAFQNCESSNGDEIVSNTDNLEEIWFPMSKGFKVKLKLENPAGLKMNIESVYLVDWK